MPSPQNPFDWDTPYYDPPSPSQSSQQSRGTPQNTPHYELPYYEFPYPSPPPQSSQQSPGTQAPILSHTNLPRLISPTSPRRRTNIRPNQPSPRLGGPANDMVDVKFTVPDLDLLEWDIVEREAVQKKPEDQGPGRVYRVVKAIASMSWWVIGYVARWGRREVKEVAVVKKEGEERIVYPFLSDSDSDSDSDFDLGLESVVETRRGLEIPRYRYTVGQRCPCFFHKHKVGGAYGRG
ncbi:hypothetical protein L873DRAFT_1794758 [Choiromyces venosus 120613-1]|uniref:Uncharacterized protein n=1 Tax=Choiromyces venosus 120613-1 TaxID=1336337 RepID=A0A3N4J3G8_9PEZI|nr:hypothetical protein L873DRAFT_1794758 [Choiromyces venosus 120613-1]